MSSKITEQEVKNALKIDSFRNIPKEKIMEFASLIPNMDKDVAISIINQFPSYAESAEEMINQFKSLVSDVLKSNDENLKETFAAYKVILDDLSFLVKKEDISDEERKKITEKMIEVADKISEKDTENKEFLNSVLKYGVSVVGGALVLGAVILGVNVKGVNIPKLSK